MIRELSAAVNEGSLHRALEVIERVVAERHDRPSLVSRIACEIGAEIVEGILCPGADLNSVDLAKRYATSRTPIREALMLLEKEGLVTIPPRRRPRVADLPIEDIREIYRVRAALFAAVAIEVVEKATPSDFVLLREFLAKMSRAHTEGDVTGFLWANVDFYNVFTTIARNRTAKRMIDSLLLRTLRFRRLSLSQPHRMDKSMANHNQLLDACEERDAGLAAALIRSNHLHALTALEACFGGKRTTRDQAERTDEAAAQAPSRKRATASAKARAVST
ncbi:MAG: GntR family transcriptional regulator [Xanthobacteraceae bacterium]